MPDHHDEKISISTREPEDCNIAVSLDDGESEALEKTPDDLIGQEVPGTPNLAVREALVATAAKFLQTRKVASSDNYTKQLFLSKKGLTPLELREAFSRAGLPFEDVVTTETDATPLAIAPPWQLPPSAPYHPGAGAVQVAYRSWGAHPSLWERLREFCNLVLFVTGAAYGANYLYLHVIRPWLTGRRPPEPLEMQVARLQAAVADSLVQLKSSVAALQQAVQGYTAKNCPACGGSDPSTSSSSSSSLGQQLQQVKVEVTSLKALMLNRRNFTATPSLAPSIPAWQRSNGVKDSGATATNDNGVAALASVSPKPLTKSGLSVTSDPTASSTSGTKDLTLNKADSSESPMSVTKTTIDSVTSDTELSVTKSELLPITHSGDSTHPSVNGESDQSNASSEMITSSHSVASDGIMPNSDRPDRTSSTESTVFSDALDSGVMNEIGSKTDLITSDNVGST